MFTPHLTEPRVGLRTKEQLTFLIFDFIRTRLNPVLACRWISILYLKFYNFTIKLSLPIYLICSVLYVHSLLIWLILNLTKSDYKWINKCKVRYLKLGLKRQSSLNILVQLVKKMPWNHFTFLLHQIKWISMKGAVTLLIWHQDHTKQSVYT